MRGAEDSVDEALAQLVREYGSLIREAVARVSRRKDSDLGDEIVQRVTIAIWKQLGRAQTIDHPASYLYKCAVRETIRELRREIASEEEPEHVYAPDGDASRDPEHAARAGELARATDAACAAMHPERALAVRAHVLGFPVEDIMKMYGWSYQKARNLVARGMADLRRALGERGYP